MRVITEGILVGAGSWREGREGAVVFVARDKNLSLIILTSQRVTIGHGVVSQNMTWVWEIFKDTVRFQCIM